MSGPAEVEVKSRSELRAWLAANHTQTESIWLIHYKKQSPHYLPWPALVRELLCWGWIDGQAKRIDAERIKHRISPRRQGSHWSRINKGYVPELEAAGLMTDAGRAAVARAKADGSWDFLDDIEALVVPDDLQAALDADTGAADTWAAYPAGEKKQALFHLKSARRPATRARRLAKIVANAAAGERTFT